APASRPMIVTTTRSSSSVKPLARVGGLEAATAALRGLASVDVPNADVGIEPFAARLVVAAECVEIVFTALAGIRISVRITPWVDGDLAAGEIAARVPVRCRGLARIPDQRLEAVLVRRIAIIIEIVQLERRVEPAEIGLHSIHRRGIDAPEELRPDDRGEQPNDHDDDHDLDQRETALR